MKSYFIFIIICFTGCISKYPEDVNLALELAKDNAKELKEVLDHYKGKEKDKYNAACFIIANMQYHNTSLLIEVPLEYRSYFAKIDSFYSRLFCNMSSVEILSYKSKANDSIRKAFGNRFLSLPSTHVNSGNQDITTIKAEFLIKSIDQAFHVWKTGDYAKKINYSEFLEFILPYRTTEEMLTHNKIELYNLFANKIFIDVDSNFVENKIGFYKAYIDKIRWLSYYIKTDQHLGLYDLFLPKFKNDCHNIASWTSNIFRSRGIPTVYEYTPQWQDRTKRHFWCVTPDSLGILKPYTPPNNNLMEDWESDLKYAGKVYRRSYGANKKSPHFLRNNNEYIPEELNSPLIHDQTFRYHQTVTLTIPFMENTNNKLAYICFFDNTDIGLKPIGWGEIDKKLKQVTFRHVPLNVVFFLTYFSGNEMIPFGTPFLLKADKNLSWISKPHTLNINEKINEQHILYKSGKLYKKNEQINDIQYIPIKVNGTYQDMVLYRKYPEKRRLKAAAENLQKSVIIASHREKNEYDTLYRFTTLPSPYLQEIKFKNSRAYRYYRLVTKDKSSTNIAHLEFLGKKSLYHICKVPTSLPIFFPGHSGKEQDLWRIEGVPLKTGRNPEHAFDNNMETYVGSSTVGMDFEKPICIKAIRFIPRNANNMIVIGDKYELYYYDNGWQFYDIKIAEANYITFEDVPAETIYLLKNITNGREEFPFFYKNKQLFLNINMPQED